MPQEGRRDYSEEAELMQLRHLAEEVFRIRLDTTARSGSEANVLGIRSKEVLFSRRLDSRTFFVQDSRYGIGREAGAFQGSDKEYTRISRGILKRLKIPASEIEKEAVFKEQTQVARLDHETKKVHKEKVQAGKHFVRLSRAVEMLPVWSSGMVLGLKRDKSIGYLQLHWPELPACVVHEAHRLAHEVKQQWRPPEQPGAEIESVEAGIIHSPAIGFLMDIYPTIRVIYKPKDASLGQKPVYFYDRHGKSVSIPRQADMPVEVYQQRHGEKRD
jgi:hypothetical protein